MTTTLSEVRVLDVMQKEICWAEPGETMQKAARRMFDRKLRCLLVRGAAGELPGIVTSKDVVNLVIAQGKPALDSVLVADVMTKPAICVPAQATMNDCAQLMRIAGLRRLPVLQGTDVIGLLSSSDVFTWMMRS
jgi:CBS domain-containing protein